MRLSTHTARPRITLKGPTFSEANLGSLLNRSLVLLATPAISGVFLELRRGKVAGFRACGISSYLGHEDAVLLPENGRLDLRSGAA